ncbi:MAG: hypothetical protein H8E44_35480 [Planctomycetes bacterium]|nr:hypothetical protein [Planctomycetota bacterium]MBL7038918.1 hypothetical protein [Pirellulaceae bacterium]
MFRPQFDAVTSLICDTMAHHRRAASLARCGAVAMTFSLLALSWPSYAVAGWKLAHITFWDDGTYDERYENDETGEVVVHYDCYDFVGGTYIGDSDYFPGSNNPGNPDPTEGSGTGSSIEEMIEQAKRQGVHYEIQVQNFKTPLGKHLLKINKGMIDPSHNPSDDDDAGSSNPGGDPFGGEAVGGSHGGGGGGGGFDPNGGSLADQLKNSGKRGDQDGDGEGGGSSPPGPKGEALPGPPELVNPPWEGGFVLVSPFGSSRDAQAGRVVKAHAVGPANAALRLGAFGPTGARRIGARPPAAIAGGR